ncbi:hypothetical protein ASPZODRAFT_133957 [Penicilliopsis zonata CBS 506.65]|uniref:Uncharacterized protein n=1 Tax=Penicilliopsis zonata CBS 506.65 TaxID=1073090 RepID=A0A1L9SDL6_9EURO|nr:hypothetical protein ASPZODRAFT_133957 [Penicilliopsis zonata CBS 506.65]OJJ45310.1 hypothetical protein ASPZODRAFT_133957 [Penicilliopsis zonata CBS 506.65]
MDPAMDEFAQTRGADDLFDDEIVPVATEAQAPPEPEPVEVVAVEVKPEPEVQVPTPRASTPQRPRGGERGRGRGRGRGGRGSHAGGQRRGDTVPKPTPEAEPKGAEEPTQEKPAEDIKSSNGDETSAEAARVPAVRGDRSATGGLKKPKLTEEELAQRIAAAKENAARKAAAHARAEADQASFMEREKVAAEKRRQEVQNRRAMDSERERNRLRKLNALGGREWDATKREEDYNPRGGGSQFRRGMHGGVSGYTRRDHDEGRPGEETAGRGRGGRGGRGRGAHRGRRGEASGSHEPATSPAPSAEPKAPALVVTNEAEFPALPAGTNAKLVALPDLDSPSHSISPGATWADQVESSRE